MNGDEPISGVVERITFHNLDNGYVVLKVRAPKHRDLVTVVGNLSSVVAGEYIEAHGQWVNDKTHGPQFKADQLKTTPPHTAAGIAKYLGSGLIKGIGPTYAKRIVEIFGDRTLDIIDQSPTFLSEVKGIGPQRLERIRQSWQEQKGIRSVMVFLQSYGIGLNRAVRIYKEYGDNAIDIVKSNPYRLTTDIWGVGFKTADELATRLGLPKDSPLRAAAAVRFILQDLSSKGHVGFPEFGVVEETIRLTSIPPDVVRDAIETGRREDELVRDKGPSTTGGTEDWLFLKPLFLAENGVARAIRSLAQGDHLLADIDVDAVIGWAEQKVRLELAPSQREAIAAAATEKVLVITGGPGVGKTTIVRGLIEVFSASRMRVALAAPTGRAAKRLAESTGREARTIHRLLEFDPAIGRFKRNSDNPLETDLLVVDEASMVDVVLMNQLLRAVPAWCSLVIVGDVDQLPSVGPGTVLRDLIESKVVRVVRLTHIFRQAGASYIVRAAHAINSGHEPVSAPGAIGDFYFIEADTPEAITERVIAMVRDRIPARFGLDPFRDVQVLTPMNKSELGVNTLNQRLQAVMNPATNGGKQIERFGRTFRVGDKIIQGRNNYQKEVFNGDIGRVMDIDMEEQELVAEFDGRRVPYDFSELDELAHAFACSIHKSQGSEYPAVVIPLHTQHYVMLQRNLLYTGVTRGKKLVALVGSRKALAIAVQKQDTAFRYSMLRQRLQTNESPDAPENALRESR
ncbi:MAG TPA: ATP-dependent RecD-like DNA helicase [Gemmataceae bacterium]|jgi:exodeoxyribonuclease V alpha subunit|nr:ATP-dependent RecD-like DNA helicase [Gemmataceae bacterium]